MTSEHATHRVAEEEILFTVLAKACCVLLNPCVNRLCKVGYSGLEVVLDLVRGSPGHAHPKQVDRVHLEIFSQVLDHLVKDCAASPKPMDHDKLGESLPHRPHSDLMDVVLV